MQLELFEEAVGDCIVCGESAEGSPYWLGMSHEHWLKLRPIVEHLYPPGKVTNMLFVKQLCKPFCSPECVQEHYKRVAAANLKRGEG
jgi:hypothetical protein